jgi:hypothetical protein
MPHDIPPGNEKAHGLVMAQLANAADGDEARAKILAMATPPKPPNLTVRAISQFEERATTAPGNRPAGKVMAIFVDSEDPLTDANAHAEMLAYAKEIGNLRSNKQGNPKLFPGAPEHY